MRLAALALIPFVLSGCMNTNGYSKQANACIHVLKSVAKTPKAITVDEVVDYARLGRNYVALHLTVERYNLPDFEDLLECHFKEDEPLTMIQYGERKIEDDPEFFIKANDILTLGGFR